MKTKSKWLLIVLFLSTFFGRLEWGTDQQSFLGLIEWEIISKLWSDPVSVLHPFVILPLVGQLLLLIIILKSKSPYWLLVVAVSGLGLLYLLMFFIGIISLRWNILLSTIPFLYLAGHTLWFFRPKAA